MQNQNDTMFSISPDQFEPFANELPSASNSTTATSRVGHDVALGAVIITELYVKSCRAFSVSVGKNTPGAAASAIRDHCSILAIQIR
jgi:hypothetical protein